MLTLPRGLQVEVFSPIASEESRVLFRGKEVDQRTGGLIFPIVVQPRADAHGAAWEIRKTFAEMKAFNDSMSRRCNDLPSFPRKRHVSHFFIFKEKNDYWEAIREELQNYFNGLLSSEVLRRDEEVQAFLLPAVNSGPQLFRANVDDVRKAITGELEYFITIIMEYLPNMSSGKWSVVLSDNKLSAFDSAFRIAYPKVVLTALPRKRTVSQHIRYGSEREYEIAQAEDIKAYVEQLLAIDTLAEKQDVKELLEVSDARLSLANRSMQRAQRTRTADNGISSTAGRRPDIAAALPAHDATVCRHAEDGPPSRLDKCCESMRTPLSYVEHGVDRCCSTLRRCFTRIEAREALIS